MTLTKAERLLCSHLKPHQIFTYMHWGFFYVQVPGQDEDGNPDPEIWPQTYGLWDGYWIAVIENKKPLMILGAYPDHSEHSLPKADLLLAQKLMLETDSQALWSMACQSYPHSPYFHNPSPLWTGKFPPKGKWPIPWGQRHLFS